MNKTKLNPFTSEQDLITWFLVIGFPLFVLAYALWRLIVGDSGMGVVLIIATSAYIFLFQLIGYWRVWQKINFSSALVVLLALFSPLSILAWDVFVIDTGIKMEIFSLIIGSGLIVILPFSMIVGYWQHAYNWKVIQQYRNILVLPLVGISSFVFPVIGVITLLVILWWIYSRLSNESVIKHRPDLLSTPEMLGKVITLLNDRSSGIWCGEVQNKPLYASVQDRAVIIGPPGTGKTVFLISQILEWAKSRRSFVCLDVKPEIQKINKSKLEKLGYKVITFNPTASKGHRYNPLIDLDSPESVGELASALIPSEEEENAVFNESARDFLDAIITHLMSEGIPSLPRIWDLISECESYQELLQILSSSEAPDARSLANSLSSVSSNERLMGSIYATFKANIRFLRYPNIRNTLESADFSLSEFTGNKPLALFLQFEEKHAQITGQLFSAIIGHILRYLIMHTNRDPVLLLLDEIGTVPPVAGLVQKLNTIRSRNLPTWMYWQSIEQMQRYGTKADEGPNTILAACDFQMVFRLNDNATAEWMSKRLGTVDRLVENVTVSSGDGFLPNRTFSQQLVNEPVVFPHQIQQLEDSEVICTYRGTAWRGYAKPYFKF